MAVCTDARIRIMAKVLFSLSEVTDYTVKQKA